MHYHDSINLITDEILQKYTYYWPMTSLFDQIFTNAFYKIIPLSTELTFFCQGKRGK